MPWPPGLLAEELPQLFDVLLPEVEPQRAVQRRPRDLPAGDGPPDLGLGHGQPLVMQHRQSIFQHIVTTSNKKGPEAEASSPDCPAVVTVW